MKTFSIAVLFVVATTLASGSAQAGRQRATIKGYVIDSACTFIKNLKRPASRECAVACAKAGSPLVILATDGRIYLPISDAVPATGENSRLMKYAGKKVVVTGTVYDRNGALGLVIEKVAIIGKGK